MEILVGIRTFMNFCERCTAIGELSYQDCGSISIPQYLLLYIKISKIVLNFLKKYYPAVYTAVHVVLDLVRTGVCTHTCTSMYTPFYHTIAVQL